MSSWGCLLLTASCCGDLSLGLLLSITPDFACWRNDLMCFFCLEIRNSSGMRQCCSLEDHMDLGWKVRVLLASYTSKMTLWQALLGQ